MVGNREKAIMQWDGYYPFGLTFNSYQRVTAKENKYNTFQEQEKITALDLNWIQFKWRNHDPTIGRFFNVDPLADKYVYNSPYAFAENKVITFIELEGLEGLHYLDGNGGHVIEKNIIVLTEEMETVPDGASEKKQRKIEQRNRNREIRNQLRVEEVTTELNNYYNGSDGSAENSSGEQVTFIFNIQERRVSDPTNPGTAQEQILLTNQNGLEGAEGLAPAVIITQAHSDPPTNNQRSTRDDGEPGSIAHEVYHTLLIRERGEESRAGSRGVGAKPVGVISSDEVDKVIEDAAER